jgi:NADH dehydrogenase
MRQAPVLAKNLLASMRGETVFTQYFHKSLGAVAGMGLYKGVAQIGSTELRGVLAWAMHRLYHGYAIPTTERSVRVFGNWFINLVFGRDLTSLKDVDVPRRAFVEAANSKPAPQKETANA